MCGVHTANARLYCQSKSARDSTSEHQKEMKRVIGMSESRESLVIAMTFMGIFASSPDAIGVVVAEFRCGVVGGGDIRLERC